MLKRQIFGLLGSLVFLLTMVTPLLAGGWVVVTLEELPRLVQTGEPLTVRFTIRQHGRTLVNLSGPVLEAQHAETGERIEVAAERDGFTGHYRVEVVFPTAGVWQWQIHPHPFPMAALMPALTVRDGGAQDPLTAEGVTDGDLVNGDVTDGGEHLLLQWIAFVRQWFAQSALAQVPAHAPPVEPLVSTEVSTQVLTQIEEEASVTYGRELFLAKGCATCHVHEAVAVKWQVELGPNLTEYEKTVPYLQLWLADPAGVKPTTEMPDLGLDQAEIDALAAFLTDVK